MNIYSSASEVRIINMKLKSHMQRQRSTNIHTHTHTHTNTHTHTPSHTHTDGDQGELLPYECDSLDKINHGKKTKKQENPGSTDFKTEVLEFEEQNFHPLTCKSP